MSLISLCHICGGPATNTCSSCGRPVCRNDFDFLKTVCKACLSKKVKLGEREEFEAHLFQ